MDGRRAGRAAAVAALTVAVVGLGAGSATARAPERCDGTYQQVFTGSSFMGIRTGTLEQWTSWTATQDPAGNAVWRYTYVTTLYNGMAGPVIRQERVETCTP